MKETDWEASRKTHLKWLRIILYICVPICVLGCIIFFNNRDQFFSDIEQKENAVSADVEPKKVDFTPDTTEKKIEENKKTAKETDTLQIQKQQILQVNSPVSPETLETAKVPVVQKTLFSELVPNIPCQIENKKGIIIKISVELFYSDESKRSEILIRRNELKVIVQKLIRYKEVSEIKKELIEPELTNAIKEIFDRNTLNKLEIRDMQIEKVYTP